MVSSALVSTIRVQALVGDMVLCSWARHFTLTVPPSTKVLVFCDGQMVKSGKPQELIRKDVLLEW